MTEFEKMVSGEIFNPSHISFLFPMLKSEILQRKFNRTPLWFQGRRDRIFKKLVGSIDGRPLNVFSPLKVLYGKNIHVGKNFFGNSNMYLQDCGEIFIGDNVFLGPNVTITTVKHPLVAKERRARITEKSIASGSRGCYEQAFSVHIGNDVLLYTGVIVCPGVTIGDNSVIGAGSVVTRDIPPNVLACGVPCKVVREITEEDKIGVL